MIATRDDLGIGIYSPSEAAFYARVQTRLLNRWIFGNTQGPPVVSAEIGGIGEERIVTFLDFVQAVAIRNLRNNYNIPLQKIRQAVDKAKDDFGVERPLAMRHSTFLFSDQSRTGHGELIIRVEGKKGPKFVQISGRESGNFVMKEVIELYLDKIVFDEDYLATEYIAWTNKDNSIVMNPRLRFGEPVVKNCGYTAETLWEAAINEGGLEAAAKAYGVGEDEIRFACDFYDHLQGNPS